MFLSPNGNISEVIRFFYINNKIELIVNHSCQSVTNSCASICRSHLAVYNMNENILDNLLKHVLDLRWDIQAMVLITFTKFLTMVFLSNILKNNCDLIMSRYLPSATLVEERLCFHRCLSTGVTCTSLTDTHHQADTHPLGRHPPRQTPPGRHPLQADTPLQADPSGQTPPQDGYCSGQYESYWNAFLFGLNVSVFESMSGAHQLKSIEIEIIVILEDEDQTWILTLNSIFLVSSTRLRCRFLYVNQDWSRNTLEDLDLQIIRMQSSVHCEEKRVFERELL